MDRLFVCLAALAPSDDQAHRCQDSLHPKAFDRLTPACDQRNTAIRQVTFEISHNFDTMDVGGKLSSGARQPDS